MNDFFNTIYYWTNSFYSLELDNYMYDTVPGYLYVGLILACLSLLTAITFYYVFKPVRHQMSIWLGSIALNAFLNLIMALWYTNTPLINNAVNASDRWTILDTFGFGVTNVMWSFVFFLVFSLLIKWWSPAKYIPFKKF